MKIPVKFKLFGSTYTVGFKDNLRVLEGAVGQCCYREQKIELEPEGAAHTKDAVGHTFCHELIHAILNNMGERELNDNEKFVDIFGGMLHQALTSAEYPD